ncbi:MAG: protein serine/threonine phosphatase, partial [Bacteroidetes bacterium]
MKLNPVRIFIFLLSLLLLASPVSLSGQKQGKADSLRALLKNAKGDTNEVTWLNALAKLTKSDIAEAEKMLQRSITLAQKLKYKRGEAAAYNHLSAMVDRKGDFKLAIAYLQKALEISKSINDPVGQSNSLNYIARLYWIQADYDHALDALLHAREIAVQSKNTLLELKALNGMGNIYHSLHKDSLALDAYVQSLRAAEKIKDKDGITTACNNLGNLYHLMGELDKSLEYHFRSLRIAEEQQDYFSIGPSLDNIGLVYEDQGKIEEALDCYNRSAGFSEKVGNQRGLIASNINIGNLYVKRKEYRKAEPYARKALALANVFGGPVERREPSGQLSAICENTGRVAEAFAFYKQYVALNDSVNNDEVARKSAETEMQFKYLKQTQADSIAQVKKDLFHAQELERETTRTEAQEKITIVFIAAFAIMLVLAVFIFRGYRQKQRANMEISQQKLVIEEQNKEIIDSITYARRIQRALLASDQLLTENLPEYFILYKPKDIVS